MTLNSHGDLAIVELIFYTPTLALALWVAGRHGFDKQAGWILLAILALVRIIGSAMLLASEHKPSTSLVTGATILDGVGISPLLLAMLGILKRVNQNMPKRGLHPRIFNFMATPLLVALILSIVGGSDIYSSNPSDRATGKTLRHAAIIIYVVCYLAQVAITFLTFSRAKELMQGENRLVIAVAVSTPFLACRLLYSLIGAFASTNSIFNPVIGSAVLMGIMAILMEFIVVVLYLAAGFTAPVIKRNQGLSPQSEDVEPAFPLYKPQGPNEHQLPQQHQQYQQQHQQQQSRGEMAYRIGRRVPVVRLLLKRLG